MCIRDRPKSRGMVHGQRIPQVPIPEVCLILQNYLSSGVFQADSPCLLYTSLYGLDSFEMQELAELQKPYMEKNIRYSVPVVPEDTQRRFEIKFNRSYWSNAVAMIAVVALFFFLSTPIENTEVVEGNYAQLLPNELFEMIEDVYKRQILLC